MNVADLVKDSIDGTGSYVRQFYARKAPEYAVYQTDDRVVVHYADDFSKLSDQRKAMAQLAPIRGEINGLIDSWRDAPMGPLLGGLIARPNGSGLKLRKRAERYDRRVGDALVVALEGDLTGAGEVLAKIKEDILDERVSKARLEYLLMALAVAAVFVFVGWSWGSDVADKPCRGPLCFSESADLWRGGMAGVVGAFFSIALAIRGRAVLPDLNRQSNLTDACLRMAIGLIAAVVLVALILAHFVVIRIGDSQPTGAVGGLYIAIAGFLAGFAERLVPDLLAKAEGRTGETPVLRKAEFENERKEPAARGPGSGAAPGDGEAASAAPADPLPEQAHEDGCVADVELSPDEVTADEDLPAASGGVAPDPVGSRA